MLVIGQLKEQLTNHVCLSGQNGSCAHAVVSRFPELIILITRMHDYRPNSLGPITIINYFFFFYENV